MDSEDSLFSQEREYERFKKEQFNDGYNIGYGKGFDAGFKDRADKIYAKLIKKGLNEEEAKQIAYDD